MLVSVLDDAWSIWKIWIFFSSSEQFDEFQLAILNYFDAFFERMAIENKPKPMAV